jgi:predicted dehydrogenase
MAAATEERPRARIAVIGAAWWSQGWHLPQLARNPHSEVAAIMQRSEQPTAAAFLNLTLKTKTQLREEYKGVPMFSSCEDLLADEAVMAKIDGVIICTAHACHADMGGKFLAAGKHVLMEKPMTVDVAQARALALQATAAAPRVAFMVNNTANFREQCFDARRLVEAGEVGDIHHVLCVMYSPLMFLFDDAANDGEHALARARAHTRPKTQSAPPHATVYCDAHAGWVKPSGSMVQPDGSGNGFGWGQSSHVLAWVLHVGGLDVQEVTAITHRSEHSGADLTDAALIRCAGGCSISFSASCAWPGNEYGEQTTGKHFDIKMFGSKGVLMFGGDDKHPSSGRLELRYHDGRPSYTSEGFMMENTEAAGNGPESLIEFIKACRGLPYRNGADQNVGLQAVRTLDAMYRSAASGRTEKAA